MRTLLVDDERLARVRLRKLLEAHPDIEIVAEADSVESARAAITAHAPELVFLDITMPGGSGFDLLAQEPVHAHVVFVTAYNAHALRAFDVGAIDYLVKPVVPERLAESLSRVRGRSTPPVDRISVTAGGTVRVVPISDLVLVRAEGDYSELVLRDGTTVVQKEPLSGWERRLGTGFVRVSRSALVSIADIERIEPAEGSTYRVVVRGHAEPIAVSRSRSSAVKAALRDDS